MSAFFRRLFRRPEPTEAQKQAAREFCRDLLAMRRWGQ